MKMYFKTHPFAGIALLAIPRLLFMILMEIYFPKSNPVGYQSFIVAFEFAKTPDQIHSLFNGYTAETFRNINIGNYFDFGFMISYSLFLGVFFYKAAKTFKKRWLMAGIPFSVTVLIADFIENTILLQITGLYTPEITDATLIPLLNKLHMVTWIKWGGLAVIFAIFSIKSIGPRVVSHIEGVVFIIPFIFSFWAISNEPMGVSRFTLSIALAFFLLLFYCFWYKTKKIEKLKKRIAVS